MCGRFNLLAQRAEVEALFDADIRDDFPPRYNIAPTQPILAISAPQTSRLSGDNRRHYESHLVRWGFIPSWVRQPDSWPLTFNIRLETVDQKKTFRDALHYRRVIIPASGFYEWKKQTKTQAKQPYYCFISGQPIIGFAGLMETWSGADGTQMDSAAIITCAAQGRLSKIHHRQPLCVPLEAREMWLDWRNIRPDEALKALTPGTMQEYDSYPISSKVNSSSYLSPDLLDEVTLEHTEDKVQDSAPQQFSLFPSKDT